MLKLQLLTAFLINLDLVAAENIDSWVEDPRIVPSGSIVSGAAEGIILFRQEYDAVFSIERYPHQRHHVNELFGQVCAWLIENDADREEIAQPNIDVDILDDETADIEITISFTEDVTAIKDPAGLIVVGGETYSLGAVVVDVAEEGDLTA